MSNPGNWHPLSPQRQEDIPVVRLAGCNVSFGAAVAIVGGAIRRLVMQGSPHLLVDAHQVAFEPPSLVDRLDMVRQWADAAEGRLRIAMWTRPEFIDPERFGIVAAGKFGLAAQVFEHQDCAIAWLREEQAADVRRVAPPAVIPQGSPWAHVRIA